MSGFHEPWGHWLKKTVVEKEECWRTEGHGEQRRQETMGDSEKDNAQLAIGQQLY